LGEATKRGNILSSPEAKSKGLGGHSPAHEKGKKRISTRRRNALEGSGWLGTMPKRTVRSSC